MKEEKTTLLRQRDDRRRVPGMAVRPLAARVRAVKDVTTALKHPPDTATPEALRAEQFHMTNACKRTATFNVRLVSLRFIFGVTRGRDAIKRHRQVSRAQRKLPAALGVEEEGEILAAAPGPGLTYHAAIGISDGAGLLTAEICHLRVPRIDSDRLLIHVEDGKGDRQKATLSPQLAGSYA